MATGCKRTDERFVSYGWSIRTESGEGGKGSGGRAYPDGTWHDEVGFGIDTAPGKYVLRASCDYEELDGKGGANLFDYPPVNLTIVAP